MNFILPLWNQESIKLIKPRHHHESSCQLKRRDSVWLTSQQMTDLPTPTDAYNGWPDKISQMLRYTIYRAISESDDAKGQNDAQSLVAGASNSSSSSSTVRSHGVTTQAFQIQKAMDDVLFELALMDQVMLSLSQSQFEFDPVMRPANHFYAWHEAVVGVRKQFVSEFQMKKSTVTVTRFKTWNLESLVAGTGTKRVVNRPGHTMCDSDPQRCDELGLAN